MNAKGFNTISIKSGLYPGYTLKYSYCINNIFLLLIWTVVSVVLFLWRIGNRNLLYWQKFLKSFDTLMAVFLVFFCYCSCSLISILLFKLFLGFGGLHSWRSWLRVEFLSDVLDLLLWSKVQFLWKMWPYFPVCNGDFVACLCVSMAYLQSQVICEFH